MYERGVVRSLQELGEKFIDFAQRSDSTAQAWEVVGRNDLDSFYGSTLRVPMRDFTYNGKVPYFYISLVYRTITKLSYSEWLRGNGHYMSEWYDDKTEDYDYYYKVVTKYGGDNEENPFKDTGQILQVGLHTTFDENIWMCEQGNVTCECESEKEVGCINLLHARRIKTHKRNSTIKPSEEDFEIPHYPGTGCPWFTVSDRNLDDYSVGVTGISYWFTKRNWSGSITIEFRGHIDVYQTLVFGRMELLHDKSYMFPLYIAGGNQALGEDVWVFTKANAPEPKRPTYYEGNSYYLDIFNPAMSNANVLHPTKFNDSHVSNFRVLSPEGRWKDIFAHTQTAHVGAYPTCGSYTGNWGVLLDEPQDDVSDLHSAYPFSGTNVRFFTDNYTMNEELTPYRFKASLRGILPVLNPDIGVDSNPYETGILGQFVDCYAFYSRTLLPGECIIGNKRYLSIPCGWVDRKFWYEPVIGMISDPQYWDSSNLVSKDIAERTTSQRYIRDKFLIYLGEV